MVDNNSKTSLIRHLTHEDKQYNIGATTGTIMLSSFVIYFCVYVIWEDFLLW